MCFLFLCRLNNPRKKRVISLTSTCRRAPYSASTLYASYMLTTSCRISPTKISTLQTPEPEWVRAAQLPVLLRALVVLLLLLAASPPARMQLVVILLVVVLLLVVLVVVVLVPLPVGVHHHLRTSPLAVAARPVSRGSFRQSRSSLSRSSS